METHSNRAWSTATELSHLSEHRSAERQEQGRGLYVPSGAQRSLYQGLAELSEEQLMSPVIIEVSGLEELTPIAHLKLTVRAPHAPLPGVLFRAVRMQLRVDGDLHVPLVVRAARLVCEPRRRVAPDVFLVDERCRNCRPTCKLA